MIHYDVDEDADEGFYMIRPGCLNFLRECSKYYEIVIFTAAVPEYADWIIDRVDTEGHVVHRLYRHHTVSNDKVAIKDITRLGRDLSKTIIIDNLEENFSLISPNNGITVESWFDDMSDNTLGLLTPFLTSIVKQDVSDVRFVLRRYGAAIKTCLES